MNRPAPVDGPLSRVARRKVKTSQRLLQVARQLFTEKGIYWAKVEDITELADLGKGTFYKYFDSKETIIRVLLEEGLGELLVQTEQAVRQAPSESTIVPAVIETRVDFFLANPDHLLFLHQVRGLMQLQVEAGQDLADVYDDHLQRLAQLVEPAVDIEGAATARDVATAIAAYTSGLLTYHVLFEGQEAIRRRREYFVQILGRSLKALVPSAEQPPVTLSTSGKEN
jgi:AcrR family transcriptional regulator